MCEGVEKPFVRFYGVFFLICMFRNSDVLFVASGEQGASFQSVFADNVFGNDHILSHVLVHSISSK